MGSKEGKRAKEIENYAEYNTVFSNKRGEISGSIYPKWNQLTSLNIVLCRGVFRGGGDGELSNAH